jgi:ABC-type spermidine/putrescine transport system permease subunit II
MFPRGFENAYAHEVERHKDEMRDAARHNLAAKYFKQRKKVVLPIAFLSILAGILEIVISH